MDVRPKLSEFKQGMTLNRIIMGVIGGVTLLLSACSQPPEIEVYTIPAEPTPPDNWGFAERFGPEKERYEITDSFFGKANVSLTVLQGDGGGLLENINRWRGQLGLEPVEESGLEELLQPVPALGNDAVLVDFTGSSQRSQLEERLVGVIARQGELTWFYKLMGAPSVVEKNREGFLAYLPDWH